MIFSFTNNTEKDLTIFMNPSTDQFLLLPNSTIKIYAVVKNPDDEFEYDCYSDVISIGMPSVASAKIFIDGEEMDSFYEDFDW